MTIDIQYKCYLPGRPHFGEEPSYVPLLLVRYRENGRQLWNTFATRPVDYFSWQFFRKEYYENFETTTLYDWPDYSRLTSFRDVLEKEFDGSMKEYVKFIVKAEIVMLDADEREKQECVSIAKSFLTSGWDSTTLIIENGKYAGR